MASFVAVAAAAAQSMSGALGFLAALTGDEQIAAVLPLLLPHLLSLLLGILIPLMPPAVAVYSLTISQTFIIIIIILLLSLLLLLLL